MKWQATLPENLITQPTGKDRCKWMPTKPGGKVEQPPSNQQSTGREIQRNTQKQQGGRPPEEK